MKKKNFILMFLLLTVNSFLELLSVAAFYPMFKIFFEGSFKIGIINEYLATNNLENFYEIYGIYIFLALILFIYLLKNLFNIYFAYKQHQFSKNVRVRISEELIQKYISSDYTKFLKKKLGNTLRNTQLTISFSTNVVTLLNFLSEIFIFFLLISFLLFIEFKITFLTFVVLAIILLFIKRFSKDKFYNLGVISQKYAEKLNQEIVQMFSGIREIKIMKKESFFLKKFIKINNLEASNNFMRDFLLQLPRAIVEMSVVTLIIMIISGMYFFDYTKSEIILYISLLIIVASRLMPAAIRIIGSIQRLKYLEPYSQIIISELKNFEDKTSKQIIISNDKKKFKFKKNIELKNISFYYHRDHNIFKNMNFKIVKNSCVGIIGQSGSGKSTLVDLLTGLINPTSGKILIDGHSFEANKGIWQDKISYVSQSPFFLTDTIEKNIAFGVDDKEINYQKIYKVSKEAQIYDDVMIMKDKFKTKIFENGSNLSGGQLQRIAIARALYRSSEILILDESTNSLDTHNEILFYKFLKTLKKKLTIIIISHKEKNLDICDKLYKLKKLN